MSKIIINNNKEWDYKDKSKPRNSAGIALCRYNFKKKDIEILFVKKRCTYWYTTFVLGRYNVRDDKRILFMLSRMTPEEKLIILTMDYKVIWDHNWQTHNYNPKFKNRKQITTQESYDAKRLKFEDLIRDNGNKLRLLISQSKNRPLIWEVPKGRKVSDAENDVECAVREFEEETDIPKESYMFLPIKPISFSHRDGDVNYVNKYYIAIPTAPIRCRVNFDMIDQISEIIDVRWFTERESQLNNCAYTNFLHRLFLTCKKTNLAMKVPEMKNDEFYEDVGTPRSITNATNNV
jgi:8-oxo-dGTP pyrophosphatase MutT (NUDIX family)